jgi:hypothetical protein
LRCARRQRRDIRAKPSILFRRIRPSKAG